MRVRVWVGVGVGVGVGSGVGAGVGVGVGVSVVVGSGTDCGAVVWIKPLSLPLALLREPCCCSLLMSRLRRATAPA